MIVMAAEAAATRLLIQCFCLWILYPRSSFCLPSQSVHQSIEVQPDLDSDFVPSSSTFRHFFDSDLMEEMSSSGDQLDDSSASDEDEGVGRDGQEEDEFPDASSHPVVRMRAGWTESADPLSMNQDQAFDQSINRHSYRPSSAVIDELLLPSPAQSLSQGSETGEDLFVAAGRHYRQPEGSGQRGFFQYRRGNNEHFTERHEHGASHHVKAKIRWGDKYGGYGEHYFDYNHKGIGEEMPTPRPRQQPRQRYYNRYAASEALPVHQEWPE